MFLVLRRFSVLRVGHDGSADGSVGSVGGGGGMGGGMGYTGGSTHAIGGILGLRDLSPAAQPGLCGPMEGSDGRESTALASESMLPPAPSAPASDTDSLPLAPESLPRPRNELGTMALDAAPAWKSRAQRTSEALNTPAVAPASQHASRTGSKLGLASLSPAGVDDEAATASSAPADSRPL